MATAQLTSPSLTSGNGDVAGGNTSETDLSANKNTTDWAGFYGTLDSTVELFDSGDTFYEWTAGDVSGSAIVASEDFSGDKADLTAPNDPTALTGVPTGGVAGVNKTYTGSSAFNLVNSNPTNSTVVDYSGASSFNNYLYEDTTDQDAVYAAEAVNEGTAFNGDTADYQLLVGTTESDDTSETFSFYVELS